MLKVKADLKAELLKPRYRDAFGPALSAVLIEQGLAAQLCNSLYEQEKKLERELAAEGAQLGRALARPPAVSSLRARPRARRRCPIRSPRARSSAS